MYNREDPWISLKDHSTASAESGIMLYGADSFELHWTVLKCNGGADVYIRAYCNSTDSDFICACKASTDPSKDGSDGAFYCINGGTVGGYWGSCTCTGCNKGFKGTSCQTPCEPGCYPGGEFMSTYGANVEC